MSDHDGLPPVIHYIIHNNITDSYPHANLTTEFTFASFENVSCGVYLINVTAENIVGVGQSKSILGKPTVHVI